MYGARLRRLLMCRPEGAFPAADIFVAAAGAGPANFRAH